MDVRESLLCSEECARHPWETARFHFLTMLLRRHNNLKGAINKILDIGSGDLFIARSLLQIDQSITVFAVDSAYSEVPDLPEKILNTEERNRISIFEDYQKCKNKGPFSNVLMLDVLEHIKEPVSFLKDLKKNISLSPDSHVIITVPAFQFLFSKHDRFLGHYRRYTEKMLTEQLAEAGFALVESGYFFTSLLLPRALGVLVEKMLRKNNINSVQGVGGRIKKTFLDKPLHTILCIDSMISFTLNRAGLTLPGLSCYALCKNTTL